MTLISSFELIHFDYYIRTIAVTIYALFLFRISNNRLYGQLASYDLIILIILGALLGQAIIDKDFFIPALLASALATFIHKLFGFLLCKGFIPGKYLEGEEIILYEDNHWKISNLKACSLSKDDVYQELRANRGLEDLTAIKKIIMERNGKISFLSVTNA